MMGFTLNLLAKLKVLDNRYPNAQLYLDRLKTRDGFARAMDA
jgi:hypothetical protein